MAPKGQKRNAPDTKKIGATKKTRTETKETVVIEDPAMIAIVEAIQQAEKLSQNCRSMLIEGVRGSLNTPLDQRHEVQTMVVRMVEEVIVARQAYLQECFDLAAAAEAGIETGKIELAKQLSQAENVLAEQTKKLEDTTLANSSAEEQLALATALHAEKKALQLSGDSAMQEKQQNKATIQHAIDTDLKAITEGEGLCNDLLTLISKLCFDESLIKALPGTCARAPADRGAFDTMVLNQLETSLKDTLAEFSKAVEAEAAGVKERADAVEAASALLQENMTIQAKAAQEQSAAEESSLQAIVGVDVATAAIAAHENQAVDAVAVRERHSGALEAFKTNTIAPFEAIKDAKATVATPESEATPTLVLVEVTRPQATVATTEAEATPAPALVEASPAPALVDVTMPQAQVTSPEAKVPPTPAALDPVLATAGGA